MNELALLILTSQMGSYTLVVSVTYSPDVCGIFAIFFCYNGLLNTIEKPTLFNKVHYVLELILQYDVGITVSVLHALKMLVVFTTIFFKQTPKLVLLRPEYIIIYQECRTNRPDTLPCH